MTHVDPAVTKRSLRPLACISACFGFLALCLAAISTAVAPWTSADPCDLLLGVASLVLLALRTGMFAGLAGIQRDIVSRIHRDWETREQEARTNGFVGTGAYALSRGELHMAQGCSPYVWLSVLLGLCWVSWIVELVISSMWLDSLLNTSCQGQFARSMSFATIAVWWASLACRAFSPSLPLRWRILFSHIATQEDGRTVSFKDLRMLWLAHHRARFASVFRLIFGYICRPDYLFGRKGRQPVLEGVCEQDELSAAATTLAYLAEYRCSSSDKGKELCSEEEYIFGEGRGGGVSHSHAFALLGKLLYDDVKESNIREIQTSPKSNSDFSAWEKSMLEKSLELNKFAIAAYTGMLLDVPRYPGCCCIGWLWSSCTWQCHSPYHTTINNNGLVYGDNCVGGHQHKFQRYIDEWGENLIVHHGHVGQGACQVAFFLSTRLIASGRTEVVIAIRGTQDLYDAVSDALMCGAELNCHDLGLGEDDDDESAGNGSVESRYGHCHLGILLAARALEQSLGNVFDEVVKDVLDRNSNTAAPTKIWVCGHSLAGGVASMLSLRLQSRSYVRSGSVAVTALAYQPLPALDAIALRRSNLAHPQAVLALVNGDDVVSRLSVRNLERLSARILDLAQAERLRERVQGKRLCITFCQHWFYRMYFICSLAFRCLIQGRDKVRVIETRQGRAKTAVNKQSSSGSSSSSSISISNNNSQAGDHDGSTSCRDNCDESLQRNDDRALYLVGKVFHIARQTLSGSKKEQFYVERLNDATRAECLNNIVLSQNTFPDHMPWRLANGLAQALGYHFQKETNNGRQPEDDPVEYFAVDRRSSSCATDNDHRGLQVV